MNKIIVVGGGASGLVAAIIAARKGSNVTIIEKNDKLGKKILITGNGRCNYWNSDMSINHYRSTNIDILDKLLSNKDKVLPFFESIGIVSKIKNGYYYPYSNIAVSIENALVLEIKRLNIKVINNIEVLYIIKNDKFIIKTNKDTYEADKVILAVGSSACPKTGSDGFGYKILRKLGHTIINPLPALVQLKTTGKFLKDWAGIRCDVEVSLYENNTFKAKEIGEIQLTDYGVSGIVILNLSGRVSRGLGNNKEELKINFMPITDNLYSYIDTRSKQLSNRTIIELLESIVNYKLLYVILKKCNINVDSKWNELNNNEKQLLVSNLGSFTIEITGTNDLTHAQVVSGGIPLTEITDTFESKIIKDLYIAGEVLDVDGDCGGYNLGFAWMSGIKAGENVDN